MSKSELRMPILKRLAEQAMSDDRFRADAATDLDVALREYGYSLNSRELDLVHKFRKTLAEAGIDLMLAKNMDIDSLFDDASPAGLEGLVGR